MHVVGVLTAVLQYGDIARLREFVHDAMYGALPNANEICDFTESDIGLFGNANKNMGVIGQKGPIGAGGGVCHWLHDINFM